MRSLPLRLSPIDGESLLGYLARYSHTFQFEPGDVVRALGLEPAADGVVAPARHGVSLSAEQLEHAAFATAITTEVLEGMLLSRYAGRAFDQVSGGAAERQVWIWCSRFCPPCLREDGAWRLAWQLGWSAVCVRHQALLRVRCPQCARAPENLARHGYFIRDVLPPLRERLLILAELLLATPADARSTLPSRLAAALQRRGHLAENYLLDSIDPLIATRVLAHTSAHTGVDIPSLTTPPSGSDAPPAVHHARLLAAWLMRRTALASWPAVAAIIGGHPDNIGQNDHWYRAALTRDPDCAAELDRVLRGVEDWHTPAPAHPATAHHERMRDLARAIQGYAAKLLTSAHGPNMARHASIAVCREHTDLTSREIP